MNPHDRPRGLMRLIAQLLLAMGAIIFTLPLVWMACSSVKVDRELYGRQGVGLKMLPQRPVPRLISPYVDDRYHSATVSDRQPLLAYLAALVEAMLPSTVGQIDPTVARTEVAKGLYGRLRRTMSDDLWSGPLVPLVEAARVRVTPEIIAEEFEWIYRRLTIGSIRIRSNSLCEVALTHSAAEHLDNLTPEVANVDRAPDGASAVVMYDLTRGDSFVLQGTFELPFSADQVDQIELELRPDDTWHDLSCRLELAGETYRPTRTVPLANFLPRTVSWRLPGPDDRSTSIKTWIPLNPVGSGGDAGLKENQIRLTLSIHRVSPTGALFNKVRLNYDRVADHIPFWRYLRVSVFIVAANVFLTVLSCSLVAYAFARLTWPGRDVYFLLMLATMMIPSQVLMIPQFLIWKNVGAYNTLNPLWLGAAFGNAFSIFLLRQFMKTIPRDLEDAARIDGYGSLRIYWHIILPLVRPSLIAIAIFTFMGTWNDFLGPLIYLADQRLYPLAFGLFAFSVQVNNNPSLTMAASLLMTLPVIAVFFVAQRYFIRGVTLTGMKQ